MKSAYELAMEKLDREQGQSKPVSEDQKKRIAEVDSRLKAKIAEIEILEDPKIAAAKMGGDMDAVHILQEEKNRDIAKARDRAETEKNEIRAE